MKTPYRYSISIAGQYIGFAGEDIILQNDPYYFYGYVANWKEIGIEDMRNWRMGGFFRSRATSHQYVKYLAKAIRYVYYNYGVLGVKDVNYEPAKFHVDKLNTDSQAYEEDYVSEFDFSSLQDKRDTLDVQLMQGGIEELIKNNEDIEYEIPISGGAVKTVTVEPFLVRGKISYVSLNPVEEGGTAPNRSTGDITLLNYSYFDEVIEYNLTTTPNFKPTDVFGIAAAFPTAFGSTTNIEFGQPAQEVASSPFETSGIVKVVRGTSEYTDYLLKAYVALYNVRVTGDINIYLENNGGTNTTFTMYIYKTNTVTTATSQIYTGDTNTINASTSQIFNFVIDASFNLNANDVIYIVLKRTAGSDVEWMMEAGQGLDIEFNYYTSQFTATGLSIYETAKQLISKATGGLATFQSELLSLPITYAAGIDCRPESILILSGDSIRGVTSPKIKISLKDFLKSLDVMLCAGLAIEDNVVKIEKRSYFFQRLKSNGSINLVGSLSNLEDWTIEDAEDLRFNELHIGYQTDANDVGSLNGKDEFNTTLKFSSSYTKNKNVMDLVSPIYASGFEIYLTHVRHAIDNNPNKDTRSDNKVFALQWKYNPATPSVGTALYPTDISASAVVTGVTDTNRVLNIGLSPKRCLLRRLYWLLSHFYTTATNTTEYLLSFQTADRNPNLQARLSTNLLITEAEDIYLDQSAGHYGQSRLFYPMYVKPETVSPENYKQRWADNRYGVFTVDIEDINLECYPLMVKERNEVPKVHEFNLILSANNTPSNLIR